MAGEVVLQGQEGGVVILKAACERGKGFFHLRLCAAFKGGKPIHLHGAFGDGAGFVQAQGVHPGQGFDAVHILHQGFVPGKLDDADRKGQADEQHQAFGNHAHHGGAGADHRALEGVPQDEILLPEQQAANGQDGKADDFYNQVNGIHNFGIPLFHVFGVPGDFVGIVFRTHMLYLGGALAAYHKAAGKQGLPRLL